MTDHPRLRGFDPAGEVFVRDERILRGITQGLAATYRKILGTCQADDLFSLGIVKSWEADGDADPYEMLIEHERIPFITYPHEWAAPALKDAALFHIDLFIGLPEHGLTLKDWHLGNILFRGTSPVFVDFASLIPLEELPHQAYLSSSTYSAFGQGWDPTSRAIFEMYRRMFFPDGHLPLHLMDQGRHPIARKLMRSTALNTGGGQIKRTDVFRPWTPRWFGHVLRDASLRKTLGGGDHERSFFFNALRSQIERLQPAPRTSSYVDYYQQKGEAFPLEPGPAWREKQRSVFEVLETYRPRTVLDVACNTGWFSMLAERHGADVLSIDTDEASISHLYQEAKDKHLNIVPLVMDILDPTPDIYVDPALDDAPALDAPLLLSSEKRFQGDLVIALGLVHHLALGQGETLERVVDLLRPFVGKRLLVEFVDPSDPLIVEEPDFFPAIARSPHALEDYRLDRLLDSLGARFGRIEVLPSHPDTRKLILCET